ncbi:MAG: COX15/CtaA family protein [Acidimicrobiia bacterium]|nr:COX15/CtaA family protein [Acidimicrobiia bacterium]
MAPTPTLEAGQTTSTRDPVTVWLVVVAALIVMMVLVGGFVRLSRAGLSIVEWDVVTGVVPPIGEEAWEDAFAAYRETPEYQLVNEGMTLSEFQYIFYLEWAHRLVARIAGLIVVVPLIVFMLRGTVGVRESLKYWGVVVLFGLQGAMGWVMVASGLEDRPVVSDVRLTIHLLAAVALLGIVVWMALDRIAARSQTTRERAPGSVSVLAWVTLALVVLQIGFGGIVAGLKAGHVSNTWPLMFGSFVPPNLLSVVEPWWMNLIEPLGSHWVHRWLAFVVAGLAVALLATALRNSSDSVVIRWSWALVAITGIQIGLGVATVMLNVPKWFALTHQGVGIAVFLAALVITHRVTVSTRAEAGAPTPSSVTETVS